MSTMCFLPVPSLVRKCVSNKMEETRLKVKQVGTKTEHGILKQASVELELGPMHPCCFGDGTHPVLPPSHKDVASVYLA